MYKKTLHWSGQRSVFAGLGYLMVFLSFNFVWYYMSIMGWVQYYFVNSFAATLPWTTCGNWWNTKFCKVSLSGDPDQSVVNETSLLDVGNSTVIVGNVSAAMEFWLHNVLRMSDGLESMGDVQWHLVLSNFIAWSLVVAALIKGARSLGKVVYVTATAPYLLLTALLIRGLTLDGAVDGILWYITPDWNKLGEPQVWLDAAIQVFYSLGPTYGGVISMARHNKFAHKSFVDVAICVTSDIFTAFYAGLAVFAILGFMAKEAAVSVEYLAQSSGPGLAFVAYPEAISRMPLPQLWAVLFFLTLITMAFDTSFATYETVIDTIFDMFPRSVQTPRVKRATLILVALLLFLLGIPLTMNGGIYLFKLVDWYIAAFALLFGSSLECIVISWIYGSDRLAYNIEMMTGRRCSRLLRFLWGIPMTGSFMFCFFIGLAKFSEPNYGDGYVYEPYAIKLGLLFSVIPVLPVFIVMFQQIYTAKGTLIQRIVFLLRPSAKWEPVDEGAREECRSRPYLYESSLIARVKRNFLGDKNTPWI